MRRSDVYNKKKRNIKKKQKFEEANNQNVRVDGGKRVFDLVFHFMYFRLTARCLINEQIHEKSQIGDMKRKQRLYS